MIQHAALTVERWSGFTLEQQVLSIAAEMLRARNSIARSDRAALRLNYERVLRLVDLTIESNRNRSLWRELLRWRELVASLYIAPDAQPALHHELLRVLLRFTPGSARQVASL